MAKQFQPVQLDSGLVPVTPCHAKKIGGGRIYSGPRWVRPDGNTWMSIKDFVTQLPDNGWRVDVPGHGSAEIHPDAATKLAIDNAKVNDHVSVNFGPELDISTAPDSISYTVTLDNATQLPNGDVEIAEIDGVKLGIFFEDWRRLDDKLVYDKGKFTVDLKQAKAELIAFGETTINLDPTVTLGAGEHRIHRHDGAVWADVRNEANSDSSVEGDFKGQVSRPVGNFITFRLATRWASGVAAVASAKFYCKAWVGAPANLHVSKCDFSATLSDAANRGACKTGYDTDPIGFCDTDETATKGAGWWSRAIPAALWEANLELGYVYTDDFNNVEVGIGGGGSGKVRPVGHADEPYIEYVDAPEIEVWDGAAELTNGVSTVAYGSSNIGTTVTKTITVKNTGLGNLTVTGQPTVTSDYTRSDDLDNLVIAPAGQETFDIRFDATGPVGPYNGVVTILSDDADEATFTFNVTATATAPEIKVWDGVVELTDGVSTVAYGSSNIGTTVTKTITIENTGTGTLTISAQPTVTSDFTRSDDLNSLTIASGGGTETFDIRFDATGPAALYVGTVTILSDDASEATFTFDVSATATAPEIEVWDGAAELIDGVSTVAYGNTPIGTPVTKTFTVKNTGTGNLTVSGQPTVTSDYTRSDDLDNLVIAPAGQETFDIRFDATGPAALYVGTVTILSDDADEATFTFDVSATADPVAGSEIEVWDGAVELTDGVSTVAYGNTTLGITITKTITVKSTGVGNLTVTGQPTVTSDYTRSDDLDNLIIAPAGEETFDIRFDATGPAGFYSGTVTILSDDADEATFTFTVTGTVTFREIRVWDGLIELIDGVSTVAFGNTPVGIVVTKTITIENIGTGNLTITNQPTVDSGFAISANLLSLVIESGETGNFDVSFDKGTYPGYYSGTVTILSNDVDEGIFTFTVTGIATSSEVATLVGKIDLMPDSGLVSGDQIVISWLVPDSARRSEL